MVKGVAKAATAGDEVHEWPTAPSHTHNGSWAASDLGEKWWSELFLPGFDLRDVRDHWDEEGPAGPKL